MKKDKNVGLSRRNILKWSLTGLVAGLVAPLSHPAQAALGPDQPKALIVYFSRSGNTRSIARHIHSLMGGDMVELQTVKPYPDDYRATTEQAKKELESGFMPPLKTKIVGIETYDVIFVGSPNWWGTVAGPVRTFLSEYDVSAKTLAPFITHEGSALGQSVADIKKLCPGATLLDGLAVRGSKAATAQSDVAAWLHKIGLHA